MVARTAASRGGIPAAGAVIAVLVLWLGGRVFGKHEAAVGGPPSPPGTFRATAQQLKTLTIAAVGMHGFVSEELTEGKIAVNGDRATPVFSPYSGRVTAGDRRIWAIPSNRARRSPRSKLRSSCRRKTISARPRRRSSSRASMRLASMPCTTPKAAACRTGSRRRRTSRRRKPRCDSVRNRLRILGKSRCGNRRRSKPAQTINPVATLTAPIAGVVVDRQVGPGQYLQAGKRHTGLHHRRSLERVAARQRARERMPGSCSLGQAVEVHVLAYPKRAFKARVTYVAALVDPATHRLPVRAEIDNRDRRAEAGDVREFPHPHQRRVGIARRAGSGRRLRRRCRARLGGRRARACSAYRAIRTGRSNDGLVEVLDGLKPGERSRHEGRSVHRSSGSARLLMNAIVTFALRQRVLIVVMLVMMLGAGVASFLALNIEAYPDPVPPLVDVVTQSTGQSAEEIERYITIPLEIQMAGIPNVQAIRTISLFGLSDVKVQFTYDFTYYQAEQWVTNRLSQLGSAAERGAAADFAHQPHRRDLPLSGGRAPQLFGHGPQDSRGLGAGAALQGGARGDRRDRLGRQDQDLRHRHRSAQTHGLRTVRAAGPARRSATPTSTSAAKRSISARSPRWCAASG